jgi:group I intron endonuclease
MVGIYKITSPSGRIYVGQSIDIEKRKNWYGKYVKHSFQTKIKYSIQKYTWENHIHEVIEECSIEQLNERETHWKQYYLDQFNGDWGMVLFCNLHDNGGGPLSEETKQKISKSKKNHPCFNQEWKNKISKGNTGKIRSEETKQKMKKPKPIDFGEKISQILSISPPNKGKIFTDEHKEKISKSNIGKKHTQESKDKISKSKKGFKFTQNQKDKIKNSPNRNQNISISKTKKGVLCITNQIKYNNIKHASLLLNVSSTLIRDVCLGIKKYAKGYEFQYL